MTLWEQQLRACGRSAQELGMHRNSFTRLMQELGADPLSLRVTKLAKKKHVRRPEKSPENEPCLQELVNEREGFPQGTTRIEAMMLLANPARYMRTRGRLLG